MEGHSSNNCPEPLNGHFVGEFAENGEQLMINVRIMSKMFKFRVQKKWHGTTGVRHER